MDRSVKFWGFIALLLIISADSFSSHLKAGEIIAQRIGPLSYKFILIIYTDVHSVDDNGVDEPDATLVFDDKTSMTVSRDVPPGKVFIGSNTYKNTYTFYKTFSGLGTYKASYQRDFRNAEILNMDNSSGTPFYVESTVSIRFGDNSNSLPVLTNPPIGHAKVGEKYVHNPGAYDAEGDSISYELAIPKKSGSQNVDGYGNPNVKPVAGGNFSLDPIRGDLVWDAPLKPGLYNVAFYIKEWRNGRVIGTILRDMQIEVEDTENHKPQLTIPADTCIVAGTILNNLITATDPDGDKINLTAYSGVFGLPLSPATFSAVQPQASPAKGFFNWSTLCDHVREQPYLVVFKAEDIPAVGEALFDQKSWMIKVLGPKPEGLTVSHAAKGLQVSWDAYPCPSAEKMVIYRKDCDSTDYTPDACTSGLPGFLGFKKVGEVSIGTTSFNDTTRLFAGSFYCYRIVAFYPLPDGGKSYVSEETCIAMNQGEPLPTNVTVEKTDSLNGKIRVQWTQPYDLDKTLFPGPYKYVVQRAEGLTGTQYVAVDTLFDLADTVTVDSMINTFSKAYNYKVEFYYNTNVRKAATSPASSVFLSGTAGDKSATLTWTYKVPWNNEGQYHRIYQETSPGVFTLIDSVYVTGGSGTYTVTGLTNQDTARFYIQTVGEYCMPSLPPSLLNNSQIAAFVPRNMLPPCPPLLYGPADCIKEGVTQLTISWKPDLSPGCNGDIKGYNVYYAEHEGEAMTLLAANITDTFYVDKDNYSLAGCYGVTAYNYYGVESPMSNRICTDICVYYELPNLITPNNDGRNDVFRPFPVPENVSQVKFTVYNRWGEMLYFSDNDINLNWPGIDNHGNPISSGIYYFNAEVIFKRRLNRADEVKNIKGWVHVVIKEIQPVRE